jgi:ATP-binding cassette subfamily F protein 3
MPLLTATNIKHAYGTHVVLDGATLSIEPGQRVGLVGRNGAGKSTLVKVLCGVLKPDSGQVGVTKGRRVGHLKQEHDLDPTETLKDAAEGAFAELHHLHRRLHQVFDDMAHAEGDALDKLMRKQADLESKIEAAGGYAIEHRIEATLHGLGFTDQQFGIKCANLSGGQKSRLMLARLLLEEPDMLLLDEPTNHLDINGRLWLENFLTNEYAGAVLMITHDRRMLDNVVNMIYEVEQGRLIEYPGNYAKFRELRAERRLTQYRAWEKQQTKFRQEEQYIQRYKTGQRAKEARGRQSKLERAKQGSLEKPLELDVFRFELPKAPRPGDVVAFGRGLTKKYTNNDPTSGLPLGERTLFEDFDIQIGRGERWGIIGPNGAGKTTLVRCLLGEVQQDAGQAKLGSNVRVGYFHQTHEGIDPERIVYRHLQRVVQDENPGTEMSEQRARDLAGAFLFSGDEQDKEMGALSGGERARVMLAGLLASAKNLLVLDEPTNHLDIPSAERLEEALSLETGYDGAIILISHDRALIDAVCDHLIVLDGHGGASIFIGNYSDWARREDDRAREQQAHRDAKRAEEDKARKIENERRERELAKERHARQGSDRSGGALALVSTEKLEQKIETIETRIRAIDAELQDPAVWQNAKRSRSLGDERAKLSAELEPLEFEWSRRAEDGAA